jgi:glycosyltransferase involved in cell wall biosynthesis
MVKVSVLMAVYNGEEFIEEAIDSVLSQTYKNIELIICNDGSTDRTVEILERYSLNFGTIECLSSEHKGKVNAFNMAYSASKGDVVCFLAHDDVLLPDSIEKRVSSIQRGYEAVYHNGFLCDENLVKGREIFKNAKTLSWNKNRKHVCRSNLIPGGLIMVQKDLAEKIFPIPITLEFEDWWICFNSLYLTNEIFYIPEPLFLYRLHKNNACFTGLDNAKYDSGMIKDWIRHKEFYDQILAKINSWPLAPDEKKFVTRSITMNKLIIERTIRKKISLPTFEVIQSLGFMKYIQSQALVFDKGYLFQQFCEFIFNS